MKSKRAQKDKDAWTEDEKELQDPRHIPDPDPESMSDEEKSRFGHRLDNSTTEPAEPNATAEGPPLGLPESGAENPFDETKSANDNSSHGNASPQTFSGDTGAIPLGVVEFASNVVSRIPDDKRLKYVAHHVPLVLAVVLDYIDDGTLDLEGELPNLDAIDLSRITEILDDLLTDSLPF